MYAPFTQLWVHHCSIPARSKNVCDWRRGVCSSPPGSRMNTVAGTHGLEWLFTRAKNAPADKQQRQLTIIRYVAGLLDQLPIAPSSERLALFAQRTGGDPHALDPDRAEGRQFLLALSDIFTNATPCRIVPMRCIYTTVLACWSIQSHRALPSLT
jgi:hypothetical protein